MAGFQDTQGTPGAQDNGLTGEPRQRSRRRTPAIAAQSQQQAEEAAAQASAIPAYAEAHIPLARQRGSGRSTRRTNPPAADAAALAGEEPEGKNKPGSRTRRTTPRERSRERVSTISELGERAHLQAESHSALSLPDSLFVALPGMRQALLNRSLDEGVRVVAEGIAAAFAPAMTQVWIADPASWASGEDRIGGQELAPTLRPRAMARATSRTDLAAEKPHESQPDVDSSGPLARLPLRADPLVSEVVTGRRPVVLFGADDHPLASEWQWQIPTAGKGAAATQTQASLGTLAAYPLHARGQFLGVLAVGTVQRLSPRHLSALEELADLAALAADRDRLLSYSRSQEALAQTVVRHAPVAIAVLNGPDHIFALANPTFEMLLGLDGTVNLNGKRLAEVTPERKHNFALTLRLDAVYEGGEPQAMIELPIHHLDRGITYWNVTSSPLHGLSASVGGVLVAAVDVTRQVLSRQRAQDVAEIAQERIGQMMTLHATSLAVASQLGADPRELLEDILRRSISLLDARAGTVYVRDARTDDLEVIVCQGLRGDYIGSRIQVGEGLAGQVALTGKGRFIDDYRAYPYSTAIYDGEECRAVIAVPLIQRGQVVGVLDVLDVAERRAFTDDDLWLLDLFAAQAAQAIENARTYVELEHAYRKQRELDRMKDDFIATASHELRTPLTGVQGFLDLLLDYPGSRDDALALDFLRKASDSAQELAEISERLLQTSRLDTGRMELHVVPVRLAPVVEDVLRSFRELQNAQGRTHDLLMEVAPEICIQADLGRLKEVIENLIGNAIKYSPQGGQVLVRCLRATPTILTRNSDNGGGDMPLIVDIAEGAGVTSAIGAIEERPTIVLPHLSASGPDPENDPAAPMPAVIAAALDQPYFMITVSDEGMGIPDEERTRLFGRFARLDSARVSQIRGTGLGLYICRQIVRAMGGDVWLYESAPAQGSVFAFTLPAAPAAVFTSADEPDIAGVGHGW